MTREEAYAILGLQPGADDQAVKKAHRQLMARFHPDRGGSDYLAALINHARDLLLGR
jgi:curved DNA-binding protein CbpA